VFSLPIETDFLVSCSLIVASEYDPFSIVEKLYPYLAGSAPIVVHSPHGQVSRNRDLPFDGLLTQSTGVGGTTSKNKNNSGIPWSHCVRSMA